MALLHQGQVLISYSSEPAGRRYDPLFEVAWIKAGGGLFDIVV